MALSNRTKQSINSSDINTTEDDMDRLFRWKKGQKVYGTFAKSLSFFRNYRRDIENAPNPNTEKSFYVDTFKPIGEQLKNKK